MKKRSLVTIADAAVFFGILLAALFSFFAFFVFPSGAKTATVTKGGEVVYVISLSENGEYKVDNCLTVCAQNGEIYVKESVCNDKICEKTGKISKSGSSIICLPSQIVVSLSGEGDFDALT